MILALAFSFAASLVPHLELPSTFDGGRLFTTPRVRGTAQRLVLWVDSDGSGFLKSTTLSRLQLRTPYLPALDPPGFPPVTGLHGALPQLNDADVRDDPVFSGIDGQLGWSWLQDHIWTIDYVGRHFYLDYTAPEYRSSQMVALSFATPHPYPRMPVSVEDARFNAALDTAATVALNAQTVSRLADQLPAVRATSFARRKIIESWHASHPEWTYLPDAGLEKGVAMIEVPAVRAGQVTFTGVWFTSRPNDDVFEGDPVDLKLGPSAFSRCAVTIDYVHDIASFECAQ